MKFLIAFVLAVCCSYCCTAQTSPDSSNASAAIIATSLLSDSSEVSLSGLDPKVREEVLRQLRTPEPRRDEVSPKHVNFERKVDNTLLVVGGLLMATGCIAILSKPSSQNVLIGTAFVVPGAVVGLIGLVGKILD